MALSDAQKALLKKQFEKLTGEVELIVFTQENECQFCKDTKEVVLEVASLSPKIKSKVYDFVINGDEDIKYNIKKIPAIAIVGKTDYGVRYYGVPAGYEFAAFVEDIIDVSRGGDFFARWYQGKTGRNKKASPYTGIRFTYMPILS